jgi:hypothetical protein
LLDLPIGLAAMTAVFVLIAMRVLRMRVLPMQTSGTACEDASVPGQTSPVRS